MNLIIQTCTPQYRLKFYEQLVKQAPNVKIISGDEYYTPNIKSDKSTPNVIWIKNYFFLKRKFLFQSLPLKQIFRAKNVVIEFNLRNLSFYIVFLLRLLFFKNTYLWGHIWSRKGKNSNSEIFRYIFKRLAKGYIAYTVKQKKELEHQLKSKTVYAACNALFGKEEMIPLKVNAKEINNIIYVGRLVKEKKVFALLKSFHQIIKDIPSPSRLIIVGDGPEFHNIKQYVHKHNLLNNVELLGHVSDYNRLQILYSKSLVSVSPGYVGLSITQSLGFGVPMIISKNEPHSPEIEAAQIGFNATFFETDNIDDLANKMRHFYNQKEDWISKRDKISNDCKEKYSVEKMVVPFIKIFSEK